MYLAVDIGGTKTLLALFSNGGRVMKRLKFPTSSDPAKFTKNLIKALNLFFPARSPRRVTLTCVTVAIAASVDGTYSSLSHPSSKTLPTTVGKPLKYGNLPWQGFAFVPVIENCIKNLFKNNRVVLPKSAPRLSVYGPTNECCPIYIENDANLAALYEAKNFKGKTVYLTFSTGIGGGIVENGALTPDSDTYEPGHVKYTWHSKRLEYEDIASATALKDTYGVQATDLSGKAAYQDIALRVSTGLSDIIRQLHPDRVIIGGALGLQLRNFKRYLTPILAASLNCSPRDLPPILPARFPLESVIYGCYLYGRQQS